MSVLVSDLGVVPSDGFPGSPLMAATLALTGSGNISLVSDLGVVPSDGFRGSPLMAATLA